jgi:hypothetical protein
MLKNHHDRAIATVTYATLYDNGTWKRSKMTVYVSDLKGDFNWQVTFLRKLGYYDRGFSWPEGIVACCLLTTDFIQPGRRP